MIHKKKRPMKFSVDGLMLNVARTLIQDFRRNLDDPSYCSTLYAEVSKREIKGIRKAVPDIDYSSNDPYKLKADYQMQSLFKRYRFKTDLYSDSELESQAIEKFVQVQDSIAAHSLSDVDAFTHRVLDGASVFIARVLGRYSDEEHRSLCKFGKRASVGIPSRMACEAARWELPISGSLEQIAWFDAEMRQVDCVQDYWANQLNSDPNRSIYQVTSSLKLTLVPKTFKSLRAIMPNTTIGSYMSYGVGDMIRKRLKGIGYDISTLQMRHRSLARSASIHGMWTTMDLSSASDTISVALVQRLFPPEWFEILNRSRIGTVVLPDKSVVQSQTFCTMGIGYTFPLQTLVFLSILKTISALIEPGVRNTISVYGDDMIFPSWLYQHVVSVFKNVGFMVNIDKTYHVGHFRESCGGDYCHGVDVRPFQPQNGSADVGKISYEAVLYKYVNTLLARWSEYEVTGTLEYLLSEIGRVTGAAKVVPVDFPDDSGIKCPTMTHWAFLAQRADVATPKRVGHGIFRFSYLRFHADERKEERHEPFLWLALRELGPAADSYAAGPTHSLPPSRIQRLIDRTLNVKEDVSPLSWVKDSCLTVRLSSGCRTRRLVSHVAISHSGRYKRESGLSRFEDRRCGSP